MFANAGKYEACGIFTRDHFILLVITIIGIFVALKYTVNKDKNTIYKIIKYTTIIAWILEVIKIYLSKIQ